jgi:cytochrome c oxidase cbb3-type subunit 3
METKANEEAPVIQKQKYDGQPIIGKEFDGIKELNNPVPPWLMWLWYASIIFAAMYFVYYHVYKIGDLQEAEYQKQMAKANAGVEESHQASGQLDLVLLTSEDDLAAGETIFKEKLCATCHGQQGEGNVIGPNLTDKYWLHGGTVADLFEVIKNGVPAKGMTPYKDQLSDEKILQVASFILERLQGSNPPNAKEPQGEAVE